MNKFVNKSEVLRTVNILIRKQREENYFDSVYDVLTYLKGLLWQMDSVQIRDQEQFCTEGEKKEQWVR